jgi:two-component system, OmpR family, KDP operon response regulator KdpE
VVKKVLIVEDDSDLVKLLKYNLEKEGFKVNYATDGAIALAEARRDPPDLVILDLMLPGLDGLEVCRQLRRIDRFVRTPVLILSARNEEADRVVGLEVGADDYVTKPFSTSEFVARVRAVLRRARLANGDDGMTVVHAYGLVIDVPRRRVTRGQVVIRLTPIEWDILRTLVSNAGRTLTHQQIFDAVWGSSAGSPQQYLRVHVTNLRRKIEANPARPELIVTEPGVGYRAEVPA